MVTTTLLPFNNPNNPNNSHNPNTPNILHYKYYYYYYFYYYFYYYYYYNVLLLLLLHINTHRHTHINTCTNTYMYICTINIHIEQYTAYGTHINAHELHKKQFCVFHPLFEIPIRILNRFCGCSLRACPGRARCMRQRHPLC